MSKCAFITAATGYRADQLMPFLLSFAKYCGNHRLYMLVSNNADEEFRRQVTEIHEDTVIQRLPDTWFRDTMMKRFYVPIRNFRHRRGKKGNQINPQAPAMDDRPEQKAEDLCPRTIPDEEILERKKRLNESVNREQSASRVRKAIGVSLLHIMLARNFFTRELISKPEYNHEFTFMVDCRDVVFQSDPLTSLTTDLGAGAEDNLIGQDWYNQHWIRRAYGEAGLQDVIGKPSVCGGVLFGVTERIKVLLNYLCAEIWQKFRKATPYRASLDQAMLNYLLHGMGNPMKLTPEPNGSELLSTVAIYAKRPDMIEIKEDYACLKTTGKRSAIMHTYDRFPELVKKYNELYGIAG